MGSPISQPIADKKNTIGEPVIRAMREYGCKFVPEPTRVKKPNIMIRVSTKVPV